MSEGENALSVLLDGIVELRSVPLFSDFLVVLEESCDLSEKDCHLVLINLTESLHNTDLKDDLKDILDQVLAGVRPRDLHLLVAALSMDLLERQVRVITSSWSLHHLPRLPDIVLVGVEIL